MRGKNWSDYEINYLEDKWGETSIPAIAKHLRRSIGAVKNKATRLGLQRFVHQGEYITFAQLIRAIGQRGNYSYLLRRLPKDGFPIKEKLMINKTVKIVWLKDFWDWAKENQTKIDFSNFEENMLGPEEEWVKNKRRVDRNTKRKINTAPWTPSEDRRLKQELNKYKYTYSELALMFGRTCGAIQRRMCDLGLKARPIKVDNHIKWTPKEEENLIEMIKDRLTYEMMSEVLGKSAKAIRGKVYRMYGSENIDKAANMILKEAV